MHALRALKNYVRALCHFIGLEFEIQRNDDVIDNMVVITVGCHGDNVDAATVTPSDI